MNKKRLSSISDVITNLSALNDRLEEILFEEQETFDNMPENLQVSANGERSESAIEILEEANDNLNEVIEMLTDIE